MSRDRLPRGDSQQTGERGGREDIKTTRRSFITDSVRQFTVFASVSALATLAAACGSKGGSSPLAPNSGGSDTGGGGGGGLTVDISTSPYTALQTVGGTVALNVGALQGLPSNGIFIIRSGQSAVTVLSRTCTHQGCQVGGFSSGVATCPCHGSQFNTSGSAVRGPASSSLTSYSATLSGNVITINI